MAPQTRLDHPCSSHLLSIHHRHHRHQHNNYYYYISSGIRYSLLLLQPLLLRDAVLDPGRCWIRPIIATRMTTRNREQTLAFRYLPFARASCFLPFAVWHSCVLLFFLPRSSIEASSRLSCVPLDTGLLNGLNLMHPKDQPIWTTQLLGCLILIIRSGKRNNRAVRICLDRTSPRDSRPGQPRNGNTGFAGLATCILPRTIVFGSLPEAMDISPSLDHCSNCIAIKALSL